MGIAVLLVEGQCDVPLGADAVAGLSSIGVTHIALVADGTSAGLVIEGWAFDSKRSAAAAAKVLGLEARTLHPFLEMAVSPASSEGGTT